MQAQVSFLSNRRKRQDRVRTLLLLGPKSLCPERIVQDLPSNIEIKARARNFDEIRRRAEELSDIPVETIPQEDIFFNTSQGRLKLRILPGNRGQLIYYTRPDQEDRSGLTIIFFRLPIRKT